MKKKEIEIYEDKIASDIWEEGTTPDEIEKLLAKNVGKRFRLEIIGSEESESQNSKSD